MAEPKPGDPEQPPAQIEREPITEVQCLEAMEAGNFETVKTWLEQEEKEADKIPSGIGRSMVQIRLGTLQEQAKYKEDALETYRAAAFDLEGIYRSIPEGDERKEMVYAAWEKAQVLIRGLE